VNRNGFRIVYLVEMHLSGVEIIEFMIRYSHAPRHARPGPGTSGQRATPADAARSVVMHFRRGIRGNGDRRAARTLSAQ